MSQKNTLERALSLFPIIGIIYFLTIYIVAALKYPGGTHWDADSVGFSFYHNYWCDLSRPIAYNGLENGARPYAMAGILGITFSLLFFWWNAPFFFAERKNLFYGTRFFGVLSMGAAFLTCTSFHDCALTLAGLVGLIAFGILVFCCFQKKLFIMGLLGAFCFGVAGISFFMWKTRYGIYWLPVWQKAAFFSFFSFVVLNMLQVRNFLYRYPGELKYF